MFRDQNNLVTQSIFFKTTDFALYFNVNGGISEETVNFSLDKKNLKREIQAAFTGCRRKQKEGELLTL